MTTFKCPKCVNQSLTSYVVFIKPLNKLLMSDFSEVTIYADTDGTIKSDNSKEVYVYVCSKGHTDITVRPEGV